MDGGGGQTSTTQNNYPAGYEDQLAKVYAKSNEVANLPFNQYTGARVADLSPDSLAAMDLARQSIGSTDQVNQQALDLINNYAGYSGLDTGVQALNAVGNPQNYSSSAVVSPLVNNALPSLNSSSAAYTQNLLGQYGADKTVPDVIQNYMNPYTQDVVDQIAAAGGRNLTENILPNINKTFVGGGAFGGSRNNEFMSRAVRDANNSILANQTNALESGYNNATSAAQNDLSRLTGTAENLGGQYGTDLSRNISGTATLSDILSKAGSSDADRQTAIAQYLQGLGSTDAANSLTASGALQTYGTNIYNQNLKDASVLEGIGQTQQQQEQNQINADMASYNEAHNYPAQQLATLESPLQSINISPTSTTTTQTQSGSPFGQVLGGLISAGSLAIPGAGGVSAIGNIVGKKKGGSISIPPGQTLREALLAKYASGGPVSYMDHTNMARHALLERYA